MVLGGLFAQSRANTANGSKTVETITIKNGEHPISNSEIRKDDNQKRFVKRESKMQQLLTDYLLEKGILLPKNIDGVKNGISEISDTNLPVEILLASQNESIFINATENELQNGLEEDNLFEDDGEDLNKNADDTHSAHKFAIVIRLKDRVPIKQINLKILGDVLMYWYANDSKEFYRIANKDWRLNPDHYSSFIDEETMLIHENSSTPSHFSLEEQGFEYKNFSESEIINSEYLPLGTSRKQLFINEIIKNSKKKNETSFAKFYDPGYYIFFLPILFQNSLAENVFVPSARVKYLLQTSVMISKTLWKKQQQKINKSSDIFSLTSDSDSDSVFSNTSSSSTGKSYSFKNRFQSSFHGASEHYFYSQALSPQNNSLHSTAPISSISMQRNSSHLQQINGGIKGVANPIFDQHGIVYGECLLNIVKTAPPRELSTSNKPIYINRVWNDALAYEISLPEKYVPLESELPIKMKFTPLDKTLKIKRIRVGVVEKIIIKNKALTTKFNQMEPLFADVTNPYYEDFLKSRKKYRCLSVLEVKPNRQTGHSSMKEVIITNCSNENIFQYRANQIDSIVINSKIKFPKFVPFATSNLTKQQLNQLPPPYGVDKYELLNEQQGSVFNTAPEESFENYITESNTMREVHKDFIKSSSNIPVKFINIEKRPLRGLYASSTSFNRVQVKHKLELVIRISQQINTDTNEYKHFEVVIDTPIVLLSDLCEADSMELPTYNTAMVAEIARTNLDDKLRPPPTFEYALSVPNSPPPISIMNTLFGKSKSQQGIAINPLLLSDDASSSDDESIMAERISALELSETDNNMLPTYYDTVGEL
ncbi:hypothetical protein QEN19_003501 [Hanseniaspora menglaensis]